MTLIVSVIAAIACGQDARAGSQVARPPGWGAIHNATDKRVVVTIRPLGSGIRSLVVDSHSKLLLRNSPSYFVAIQEDGDWYQLDVATPTGQHDRPQDRLTPLCERVFYIAADAQGARHLYSGFPSTWIDLVSQRYQRELNALGMALLPVPPTGSAWQKAFNAAMENALRAALADTIGIESSLVSIRVKWTTEPGEKNGSGIQKCTPDISFGATASDETRLFCRAAIAKALSLPTNNVTSDNPLTFPVDLLIERHRLDPTLVDDGGKVKMSEAAIRIQRVIDGGDLPIAAFDLRSRTITLATKWLSQGIGVPRAFANQNAQWRLIVVGRPQPEFGESSDETIQISAAIHIRIKYASQNRYTEPYVLSGFSIQTWSVFPKGEEDRAPSQPVEESGEGDDIARLELRVEKAISRALGTP